MQNLRSLCSRRCLACHRAKPTKQGSQKELKHSSSGSSSETNWDEETGNAHVPFVWNGKRSKGTELHVAALEGDLAAVARLLETGLVAPRATFEYNSFFQGKCQEGSGEAIHLAASRGHTEVVSLLLEEGASIDAKVKRGGLDHYDVLHAAVFAEGRGGDPETVQFLLDMGANQHAVNSDGKSVLHLAFQTGNLAMIKMFSGINVEVIEGTMSPLEQGIELGKMSWKELSESANLDVVSLQAFINREPEVIPFFLKRIQALPDGDEILALMASSLSCRDLATVIRRSPHAAMALLSAVNATPQVDHEGWHPLPVRISFESTYLLERIYSWLNPARKSRISLYQTDQTWKYDAEKFKAPDWHKNLQDRKARPFSEGDIKVCNVPNIRSVNMFAALADVRDDAGFLFEHPLIQSVTAFAYWNGPSQVDIFQVGLNFWLLLTMLVEFVRPRDEDSDWHPSVAFRSSMNTAGMEASISGDMILMRAILFLVHELIQLGGCIAVKRPWSYVTFDNFVDAFYWFVPLAITGLDHHVLLDIILILMYWGLILGGVSYVEFLAESVLPIRKLVKRLVPACLVTAVAFAACVNALFVLESTQEYTDEEYKEYHIFRGYNETKPAKVKIFYDIFSLLMTNQMNDPPYDLKAALAIYTSAVVFSVFFMNIFLGVIMEGYSIEKARWSQTLGRIRINSSYAFLLRTKIIPTQILSKLQTRIFFCASLGLAITFQVLWTVENQGVYKQDPKKPLVLFALWAMAHLCAYQNLSSDICPLEKKESEPRYLWTCVPRQRNDSEDAAQRTSRVEAENAYLRERLQDLGELEGNSSFGIRKADSRRSTNRLTTNMQICSMPSNKSSNKPTSFVPTSSTPDEEMGLGLPTLLTTRQQSMPLPKMKSQKRMQSHNCIHGKVAAFERADPKSP